MRANPKLSGTKHNVFGIQTGVAISFLVKREGAAAKKAGCRVFYARRPEMEIAEEKLSYINNAALNRMALDELRPDARAHWLNVTNNDFEEFLPVASKDVKANTKLSQNKAIFKSFSLGVVTARDDWVYGKTAHETQIKVRWFIDTYNNDVSRLSIPVKRVALAPELDTSIKYSRAVKNDLKRRIHYRFDVSHMREAVYRPFVKSNLYFDKRLNEVQYQLPSVFRGSANPTITFLCVDSSNPLASLAVTQVFDYCLLKKGNGGTQSLPYWVYNDSGARIDNITDWSLAEYKKHYQSARSQKAKTITKEAIFHYVYAVLHDPIYREKYAQNLKREFPRIPFYGDTAATFWRWADWGAELMALHIGYETVEPFALGRVDVPDTKARAAGQSPRPALKADKAAADDGRIVVDSETTLTGIPAAAWRYQLGNRCALEGVLDQYKEKKPKDPTIRALFDIYRFANYKEKVVDLLTRVTTVSVRTVAITDAMRNAPR